MHDDNNVTKKNKFSFSNFVSQSLFLTTIIYEKITHKTIENFVNEIVDNDDHKRRQIFDEFLIAIAKKIIYKFFKFRKNYIHNE